MTTILVPYISILAPCPIVSATQDGTPGDEAQLFDYMAEYQDSSPYNGCRATCLTEFRDFWQCYNTNR